MRKQTPLYQQHQQAGASFIDFHHWDMPLHYGSAIQEHLAVREDAGVFDVSHMTVVDVLGTGAREFLRYLLANDIDKVKSLGHAQYSLLLSHRGGILDDLLVYYLAPDRYRLILNCATRQTDLEWIEEHIGNFSLGVQQRIDLAMLAIQGPNAIAKVRSCLLKAHQQTVMTLQHFDSIEQGDWLVSRTGYTGEDGVEVCLPAADASSFWDACLAADIKPCGLAARDSLRLEAGLLLCGQDMDDRVSPYETGLSWVVSLDAERDFVGKHALQLQKHKGIENQLYGLILDKHHGILRSGLTVTTSDGVSGKITSGGYSPSLDCSIGLVRLPKNCSDEASVELRGRTSRVKLVKPRFLARS